MFDEVHYGLHTSDDSRSERSLWYVRASRDRGRNLSTSRAMTEIVDCSIRCRMMVVGRLTANVRIPCSRNLGKRRVALLRACKVLFSWSDVLLVSYGVLVLHWVSSTLTPYIHLQYKNQLQQHRVIYLYICISHVLHYQFCTSSSVLSPFFFCKCQHSSDLLGVVPHHHW